MKKKATSTSLKLRRTGKNTSHNSNKSGKSAKIADMYSDIFTLREKPAQREVIERILDEALQDAINDPTVLKPSHYFRKKGITFSTIERWCDKYSWAQNKYNEFKQACGDNREIGALNKKLDGSLVTLSMPKYDKEWKELVEWRAALKTPDSQTNTSKIQYILAEKYPVTTVVPEKEDNENED